MDKNGPVPDIPDRLAVHDRPRGEPIMRQSWTDVLFIHWPVSPAVVRPLLPDRLKIDTYEGQAWITVTPLGIWDALPSFLPYIPLLGELNELNVRTYVFADGVPGVWFFSLDASNPLAVAGARLFFGLPYYFASMQMERHGDRLSFRSDRYLEKARFSAEWRVGPDLPQAEPGSHFFLTERYCLYTTLAGSTYRCRINHQAWPLQKTFDFAGSFIEVAEFVGVAAPATADLLHCGGPVHVDVWPLEKLD